jgi:HPt (histidine-containing phosphotransfer) domain-containing protein
MKEFRSSGDERQISLKVAICPGPEYDGILLRDTLESLGCNVSTHAFQTAAGALGAYDLVVTNSRDQIILSATTKGRSRESDAKDDGESTPDFASEIRLDRPLRIRELQDALRQVCADKSSRTSAGYAALLDPQTLAAASVIFVGELEALLAKPRDALDDTAAKLAHSLVSSAMILGFPALAKALQFFETSVLSKYCLEESYAEVRNEIQSALRDIRARS